MRDQSCTYLRLRHLESNAAKPTAGDLDVWIRGCIEDLAKASFCYWPFIKLSKGCDRPKGQTRWIDLDVVAESVFDIGAPSASAALLMQCFIQWWSIVSRLLR